MKFRLVKKKDLNKIQKLFLSVFKRNISKEFYIWRYFNKNSFAYVNNSNKVFFHVGFVKKKLNNKKKDFILSRHSSMVEKKFQKKGLYSSFFKNFVKKIKKKNIYAAIVTWPNNNNLNTIKKINISHIYKKIYLYTNMKNNNTLKFNINSFKYFNLINTKKNFNKLKKIKSEISFFYKDFNYLKKRYIQDPHQQYYFFSNNFDSDITVIVFSLTKINLGKTLLIQDYFGSKNNFNKSIIEFVKYFSQKKISISFWKNWFSKSKPKYLKNFNKQKLCQNIVLIPLKNQKFSLDKTLIMPGDNDVFLKLK